MENAWNKAKGRKKTSLDLLLAKHSNRILKTKGYTPWECEG
jgi:hypothetical protein